MPYYPLDVPPGCYRNGTEYQSQGRWFDMNGMRFFLNTKRPVGGWMRIFDSPLGEPGRGMLSWRRNTGVVYCAVGTPNKLWIFDNDVLTDITPDFFATGVPDTVAGVGFGSGLFGGGPFGAGGGGGTRTAATAWTLAAWGENLLAMATHDNVLYEWDGTLASKATAVTETPLGSFLLNANGAGDSSPINLPTDATTIQAALVAVLGSGTTTVTGTGTEADPFLITFIGSLGDAAQTLVANFDDVEGATPALAVVTVGDDSHNAVYSVKIVPIPAPTGTSLFVTQEQFPVILGANDDQRSVAWGSPQSLNFTPTPNNNSGAHTLVTDGVGMVGIPVRGGNLILTTADAHFMDYVGSDQVYRFTRLREKCGLVGVRAISKYGNDYAVWMGEGLFFTFDGATVKELLCEVSDYVFGDINEFQAAKVYCSTTAKFGEITWFYPSKNSTECDRSVTWNYIEGHWTINGQPARTSWQDAGAFEFPIAVDPAGYLYTHENGWTDNGTSRVGTLYLRSGPIEVGAGDRVVYVTKMIPDEVATGAWAMRFATRFAPEGPEFTYGPYASKPFMDARLAGRQIAVEIVNAIDGDERIGRFRVEGTLGGLR